MEFFEPDYITELLEQGIPLIFFDFPLLDSSPRGCFDVVLTEGEVAVKKFCMELIREQQCKTFGFVGDYRHCRSFYELSGIPLDSDTQPFAAESPENGCNRMSFVL